MRNPLPTELIFVIHSFADCWRSRKGCTVLYIKVDRLNGIFFSSPAVGLWDTSRENIVKSQKIVKISPFVVSYMQGCYIPYRHILLKPVIQRLQVKHFNSSVGISTLSSYHQPQKGVPLAVGRMSLLNKIENGSLLRSNSPK